MSESRVTNGRRSSYEYRMGPEEWAERHAGYVLTVPASVADELLRALVVMVAHYVSLVESGDCGLWGSETEEEVIAARAAIANATKGKP